jgi:hypothetical protein
LVDVEFLFLPLIWGSESLMVEDLIVETVRVIYCSEVVVLAYKVLIYNAKLGYADLVFKYV